MHIAICDDEDKWINKIEDHLIKFKETHKDVVWEVFYSGEQVLEHYYTQGNVFDVVITDIKMKGINGVELANEIRELDSEVSIFFLSDNDEYMRDCFESRPINFWNKPISYDDFVKDIEKVIGLQIAHNKFLSLREDRIYKRIPYRDIQYFLNKGRKIVVHTEKKDYEFYGKFKDYSEVWEENNFYIVSRFLCINANHIVSLKNDILLLRDGTEMRISGSEGKTIKRLFFQNSCRYASEKNEAKV